MRDFRFKWVGRLDTIQGHFRLFRWMWETGVVGDGVGYSNQVSVALTKKPFGFYREYKHWILIVLFLRVHRKKSYGGRFG